MFRDPNAPLFRTRYLGHRRPRWFAKKVPMWAVDKYTEFASPGPMCDSTYAYRELSRWTCEGDAEREVGRYSRTYTTNGI